MKGVEGFPWESLGAAALSVLLILGGVEILVRQDAQRVTQDLIARALLLDERVIDRVLADDMLDQVIVAALRKRLGNADAAEDVYQALVGQRERAGEGIHNYTIDCRLREGIEPRTLRANDLLGDEPVRIEYEFEVVLQREKRTPLVFFNLASLAHGARFGFDYAETDIEVVEATVFCASTKPPQIRKRPAQGRATSITVDVDGWIPLGSGVVFSWEE